MLVPSAIDPRENWLRIFTDPDFWRPTIEEIWRRHGLGQAGKIVAGYPGSNAVFIVDDALVVKVAWPFERSDFYRELELYRLLEPYRATLLTPRVLADGVIEGDLGWPYLVMEFLPGERLGEVWGRVPREDQVAIAGHLGDIIRALHRVPLDDITTMGTSRADWARFIEERMARCVETYRQGGGLAPHMIEQIPMYLAKSLPLFPDDFTPVLLNGDITADHELLSLVNGHWRITGFIDFGDALVGHNEYEFTCTHLWTFWCDRELIHVFLRAYGWEGRDDIYFGRRMMAYCLLHPYFEFDSWIEKFGGPEHVRSLEELEAKLWRI